MRRAISKIRVPEPVPWRATCFSGVASAARLLEGSAPLMPFSLAQSRLETAFVTVLALLPFHAQATLKTFWTSGPALDTERRSTPPLVLIEPAGSKLLPKNALAATTGFDFLFLHAFVSVAPTDILQTVVVHELSHSFLRAHHHEVENEEGDERNARTTVLAWGFSEEAVDFWAAENTLVLSS